MPVSVVEGLPVSVVEHGLVDGRKTSMIILAHLVDVNRSFVGQTEPFFDSSSVVNTEKVKKKSVNRGPVRPEFADWVALGPSDRP